MFLNCSYDVLIVELLEGNPLLTCFKVGLIFRFLYYITHGSYSNIIHYCFYSCSNNFVKISLWCKANIKIFLKQNFQIYSIWQLIVDTIGY